MKWLKSLWDRFSGSNYPKSSVNDEDHSYWVTDIEIIFIDNSRLTLSYRTRADDVIQHYKDVLRDPWVNLQNESSFAEELSTIVPTHTIKKIRIIEEEKIDVQ